MHALGVYCALQCIFCSKHCVKDGRLVSEALYSSLCYKLLRNSFELVLPVLNFKFFVCVYLVRRINFMLKKASCIPSRIYQEPCYWIILFLLTLFLSQIEIKYFTCLPCSNCRKLLFSSAISSYSFIFYYSQIIWILFFHLKCTFFCVSEYFLCQFTISSKGSLPSTLFIFLLIIQINNY